MPSYWIVDPDLDRIETFHLEGAGYQSAGVFAAPETMRPPEFPELELALDRIFA
ncbi:Uma2 family endonuclease [Sulfidibacter corallicola]|uniref:Uma2 family endonuclease n=1 Tax=Sulfidibacter corallicola TaxID=2818388 RepID=A0A8A4TFX6_SULCO|nr:Uma2 family endonuclease [Sulfidibacter corallicola]QTD48836.1 Uma2 family endonuclease [Sulfidibacter corallicola]